jgi:hypothetical protein
MTARRSLRSEQVSQAILGTPVRVSEVGSRWCRIETPDEYPGWVPRRALGPEPPATSPESALIHDLWANLRARPDSRLPALMTIYIGTRLPVVDATEGWVGLGLPDGGPGWLEAHRVRRGPPAAAAGAAEPTALLDTARRFLGVPYLWGGCTPAGIDCSGFVQLVFGLHGVPLRRDTTDQVRQGHAIERDALQPADVIFFREPGSASERVTHVGILLDGTRFIHARGSQCVRINDLEEEEWECRFAAARRVPQIHRENGG